MQKTYTPEEWYAQAENIYSLISKEIENCDDDSLSGSYPKFIIMYEFFRLLRGEAFYNMRPEVIGTVQSKIYAMEDDILAKIKELKKKIDPTDSKTKFYIDSMKKSFEA